MRRKLLYFTISFLCGIVIWINKSIVILGLSFITILIFVIFNENKDKRPVILLIIFLLLGVFRTYFQEYIFEDYEHYDNSNGIIVGKITKIEKRDEKQFKFIVDVFSINQEKIRSKVLVSFYSNIENYFRLIGKYISFYCKIELPKENGNPKTFNYKSYLKSQGIPFITTITNFDIIEDDANFIDKSKSFILEKREEYLASLGCNEEIKGVCRGIIFGDKSQMDEDTYEAFKTNGTAHVLAVSGLHVGILYSIYRTIQKKRRSKIVLGIFLFCLVGYGTLTLWSISVTRAIVLVVLITIGDLLDRRYDLLTSLATICLGVLIYNPFVVLNPSFQMSFLAVVSIGVLGPPLCKLLSKGIGVMVSVQIGMIPYTAYVFNYIPLIGLICNIPIIFITSIVVPIGLTSFLLYSTFKIKIFGSIFCEIVKLLIHVNEILSNNGTFSVDVVSPKLYVIVGFYLIVFFLASEDFYVRFVRKDKKGILKIGIIIVSIMIMCVQADKSPFEKAFAVFVDVGQGDCLHLKCDNSKDLIFDGGGSINYNIGKNTLKPYLLKNGTSNIDLALATHLHTDHYKGIEELSKCFSVKRILTKGTANQIIKVNNNCLLEIIWPVKPDLSVDDENLNSLIFKIHYKNITILITGDITEEGERQLLEYYKGTKVLKCDVLKIAHHGSKYSSCDEFLDAVNPSIAVISVGKNNYGHPSNEVIEKLNKRGIILFRTDQLGAVGLIYDKGKIKICTQKQNKK